MSKNLQILVSMLCHLATYMLLGIGAIYENGVLTFLSLVSLAIGLFFGKEALENVDLPDNFDEIVDDSDEDPPLGIG